MPRPISINTIVPASGLCLRVLVVRFSGVPIDDIPECGDVAGAHVLILEVVSVLPDVECDYWLTFDISDTLSCRGCLGLEWKSLRGCRLL